MRWFTLALVIAGSVFSGCRSASPKLDRDAYIAINVEILRVAAEAPDSAAATDSARSVLARHALSETDLTEFAAYHIDDPGYMADVWGDIERRLREPIQADTTA